ncbi:hypothetical protein G6549_26900 [Bacillus sp. MM2020_1]|nr:hypothetical protein [Bacillus sp. MM2020_1]
MINEDLERDMETGLKIVELGRSIRNAHNLKVKQPLNQIIVWSNEGERYLSRFSNIIKDELNLKNIIFTEDLSRYESTIVKLNFKTAGAAFGKLVNAVKEFVEHIPENLKKALLENGQLQIVVNTQTITLKKEHINVEYQVQSGYDMAGDLQLKVIIDLKLTSQLVNEGQVRELIRAIQDTRKKLDLPVEKYVGITISATDFSKEIIQHFEDLIKENVLVNQIRFRTLDNSDKHLEVKFGDEILKVSLEY